MWHVMKGEVVGIKHLVRFHEAMQRRKDEPAVAATFDRRAAAAEQRRGVQVACRSRSLPRRFDASHQRDARDAELAATTGSRIKHAYVVYRTHTEAAMNAEPPGQIVFAISAS